VLPQDSDQDRDRVSPLPGCYSISKGHVESEAGVPHAQYYVDTIIHIAYFVIVCVYEVAI